MQLICVPAHIPPSHLACLTDLQVTLQVYGDITICVYFWCEGGLCQGGYRGGIDEGVLTMVSRSRALRRRISDGDVGGGYPRRVSEKVSGEER